MTINLKTLQAAQKLLGRRLLLTFDAELEHELQGEIWETKRRTLAVLAVLASALLVMVALHQRELIHAAGAGYVTALRLFVGLPLALLLAGLCLRPLSTPASRVLHMVVLALLGMTFAVIQTRLQAAGMAPPFSILLLFVSFTYLLTAAGLAMATAVATAITGAYAALALWHGQTISTEHWSALIFGNMLGFSTGRVHEKAMRAMFLAEHIAVLMSLQDSLTGLANRRAGLDHLERALRHSRREQLPITVLMVDVDFFKRYNDHYGHVAGDDALRRVAEAIQDKARRPLDVVCRYGGEEFLVVLYGLDSRAAHSFAEQIRAAVEDCGIAHARSDFKVVTVSVGICQAESAAQTPALSLIEEADNALYQAKADGRNRCVFTELGAVPQMSMFNTGSFQAEKPAP